jgi:ketosteroid isomerase-like protein
MSQENVEMARHAYEAFSRGDLEGMVADFPPEFEYVTAGTIPGAGGMYRGPEGYRRFVESWWDAFDELAVEVHELIEAGDRVLASLELRGRGKQSGVETSWDIWQVWTARDGKVVRGQGFASREEALEAAGLSE